MKELHLTKKDFKLDWYSGTGSGGQHRNKHQNCCRITHIESGLTCKGTANKSRVSNQRDAFINLAKKVIKYYQNREEMEKIDVSNVIRTYNEKRDEVHDKRTGIKDTYKRVIVDGDISVIIKGF